MSLRPPRILKLLAPLLTTLFLSSPAMAQEQPSLALNRFNPSWMGDRFFGVSSPYAAGHLTPHLGLILDYAHAPLVIVRQTPTGDEAIGTVVEHQAFLHLNGTFSLWNRVALNVDLPIAVLQSGDDPTVAGTNFDSPSGADLGDLRLGLRLRLLGEHDDPFQVAVGGHVWAPTGNSGPGSFVSDGGLRGQPLLILGGRIGSFVYSADVGPELRPAQTFANVGQGTRLTWGTGAGVLLAEEKLQVGLEVLGGIVMEDIQRRTSNVEVLLGGKYRAGPIVLGLAAGPGLTSGIGTPDARVVLSAGFSPELEEKKDSDRDGIYDDQDACPETPGSASDDPAKHGCPLDSDEDGILDDDDACPEKKGVASKDPKKHGCPVPQRPADTDGDSIANAQDACPKVKGEAHDDPKKHGCPPDADGDGIIDTDDACPSIAGVENEDRARHGCPGDTDGDGITDDKDACPKDPGIEREDPEKNGCPKVIVRGTEVVIMERVEFATGRDTIRWVSQALLKDVAKILKQHPEILKLEVQGHTDDRGSKRFNRALSRGRAKAVRRALINYGIDKKRLSAKGYGPDQPIDSNDTEEGRQQNRRVQFKILKQDKSKAKPGEEVVDSSP